MKKMEETCVYAGMSACVLGMFFTGVTEDQGRTGPRASSGRANDAFWKPRTFQERMTIVLMHSQCSLNKEGKVQASPHSILAIGDDLGVMADLMALNHVHSKAAQSKQHIPTDR